MEIAALQAAVAVLRGRFAPWLAQRTVRNLRREADQEHPPKVIALQPLSIKAIVEARHLLSMKYYRLDHLLPPPLLEEMMVSPVTRAMRTEPEYLRLLLSPISRSCYIIIPYLEELSSELQCPRAARTRSRGRAELDVVKRKLDDYANLVLNTAKERIRCLELSSQEDELQKCDPTWISLVRDFLHCLLDGLSDLHELSVLHCPGVVTDQTLQLLQEKHPNLTALVVRSKEQGPDEISEHSLRSVSSRCSQLEVLDVSGLCIKEEGFAAMLPHISNLTTLATSNTLTVSRAVLRYAMQEPPPPPLNFNMAVQLVQRSLRPYQNHRELTRRMFSTIPNVTNVTMHANEQVCVGLSESENRLESLNLKIFNGASPETQSSMMERFSPTLTSLNILTEREWYYNLGHPDPDHSWNLGLTAQHCTDLEHLKIRARFQNVEQDFEVEEEQFAKLITCKLAQHRGYNNPNNLLTMPDSLLYQLFSSPHLRELGLCCMEIPGHAVMNICDQAIREEQGVLSSLESLYLGNIRGMNSVHVIALMCAAPRLTEVELVLQDGFLAGQELRKVELFCHGSLPNVRLRVHSSRANYWHQAHRNYHYD